MPAKVVEPAEPSSRGRWNENTGRLAGSGSRPFVNRVSVRVDSYTNRQPTLNRRLDRFGNPIHVFRGLPLDPGRVSPPSSPPRPQQRGRRRTTGSRPARAGLQHALAPRRGASRPGSPRIPVPAAQPASLLVSTPTGPHPRTHGSDGLSMRMDPRRPSPRALGKMTLSEPSDAQDVESPMC